MGRFVDYACLAGCAFKISELRQINRRGYGSEMGYKFPDRSYVVGPHPGDYESSREDRGDYPTTWFR